MENTSQVENIMEPPQSTSNANRITPNISYVSAVKNLPKQIYPKREQAIVLHSIDNLKLFDYIKSIGTIVGPKNISFASRISNKRICIYLTKTELVDTLINNHPTVIVSDFEIPIRRLVSPAKRVIISNVCPSIPNEYIETAIRDLNLQLVSPVTHLRAGIQEDEYSHILSFRRQAFVIPSTENFELETSTIIPYEGNNYRVFLSTEKMECFICKTAGHVANNCPTKHMSSIPTAEETSIVEESLSRSQTEIPATSIETSNTNTSTELTSILRSAPKRLHPGSSTQSSPPGTPTLENVENNDLLQMPPPQSMPKISEVPIKHCTKKIKKGTTEENKLFTITKNIIEEFHKNNPDGLTLSPNILTAFLENAYGSSNPLEEAKRYTTDVKVLLDDMQKIYPELTDRKLKNRFTRISKKLTKQLGLDNFETASTCSQNSNEPSNEDNLSDVSQNSQMSSY